MNFFPVITTLCAGLATVFGALFVSNGENKKLQGFALAFATGIMLMIAIGELLPDSLESLGLVSSIVFMAIGILLSLFLDLVLPHHHDHDDDHDKQPGHYIDECECSHHDTVSKGMVIALLLHNIIEGFATGLTAVSDSRLGISMALGIALHNIPIGATLAISLMSAGKTKIRSMIDTTLIGLSQPLGAFIGLCMFGFSATSIILSYAMALVGGILIFIAFDELWPAARNSASRNLSIIALTFGLCFIPLTELFF